jgi:hypothetical protein
MIQNITFFTSHLEYTDKNKINDIRFEEKYLIVLFKILFM